MSLYHYYIHNKSINLNCDLKQFVKEINLKNKRANINNDREEIRRKLAMVSSSSSSSSANDFNKNNNNDSYISDYLRRTNYSYNKSNLLGQNLQICFMNEMLNDDLIDNESIPSQFETDNVCNNNTSDIANQNDKTIPNSTSTFSCLSISSNDSCDSILTQLQNEAKQALAQVPFQVKSKMQSDLINNKKPSPIADIVGLPTYGLKRLEREHIVDMNIGQLQVIVNDLCNQIEKINEDLKKLLIDRDDLYMQQDSILVDIEDVTKRLKEYSQRCKNDGLSRSNIELKSNNTSQNEQKNSSLKISLSTHTISERVNAFLHTGDKNQANTKLNENNISSNSKQNSLFQLGSLTNKLYRFTKKN